MEIIDRKAKREAQTRHYEAVKKLAEEHFGRDRINEFGSRNDFYIDGRLDGTAIVGNIRIEAHVEKSVKIVVYNGAHFEEAKEFGERCEERFKGAYVNLEHNL